MSDLPPARSLGQGISIITLPLPFRSPPSVNAYVIEGSTGLTLIDCGVDSPECHQVLMGGMDALGIDPHSVTTLIVSHLHPDHVGMAPRLTHDLGLRTVMHKRAANLVTRYNDIASFRQRTADLADRHGIPPSARPAFVDVGDRPAWMPTIDPPDVTVDDGDFIEVDERRHLQVLFTPGHEPSHICLRDSLTGGLFAGDHILPRITPHVGYDEMYEDVLGDFLESLLKIERLLVTTTYPAHGDMVEHGSARAEQIFLHHQRRLEGMVDAIEPYGSTAWMVMEQVFRPNLSPMDQRLALRETIAHLEHLRLRNRLRSTETGGRVSYHRGL